MLLRSRRAPRHQVEIPCELIAKEDPVLMWATDMSSDGLWFEGAGGFELGEQVVVCFKPGLRWRARELMIFAQVARISPGMRTEDEGPGVGLSFLDLSGTERWWLHSWLRPRPEKRPRSRRMQAPRWPSVVPLSPFARRLD